MELRPPKEIQRAHDLLHPIVCGEIPSPFGQDKYEADLLNATLSVLCWVLQHDHINAFPENLEKIEGWLKQHGYVLEDKGN